MYLNVVTPETPEQISPYLEAVDGFPRIGDGKRVLTYEIPVDLSVYSAWKTIGHYGLTKNLKGACRDLKKGSVQGVSMLVDRHLKPHYAAVTLDGTVGEEQHNRGVMYSELSESLARTSFDKLERLVSTAIFAYLSQEDFAVNPYEEDIRNVQDDFYRKVQSPTSSISEAVALGLQRRKQWNM